MGKFRRNIKLKKTAVVFLFLILPLVLDAQVTVRDTIITWHTFDYTLNEDNTVHWSTSEEYDIVERTFSGIVLENEYLKVTLLPEMGGRILSIIYKPTGHEELYINHAGAPYGIGEDWFYYKWLMVYGGIFPTLPEPEHGKAWLLPWESTLVKEGPDTVGVRMSWRDTVQLEGINEGKWKYGMTNLKCDFTVSLIKGKSSVEADIALYNESDEKLDYEYWTCLTLAPGSDPADPKCTEGTEIIIPATKVKIPSWYPDIASREQRIMGQIFTFNTLRYWANWSNEGIAYPWDDPNENYWGLINHDNGEGIIRVSDNNKTPGIKIWAWGYEQSQDIDPFKDPGQVNRPYVELWAGHSSEFFEAAEIDMNIVKEWKEVYVPTIGLTNVTNANNEIIANFKIDDANNVSLEFVTTNPGNELDVSVEITGQYPETLISETILPDPINGNNVTTSLPVNNSWGDNDSLVCTISDSENSVSLASSIPLNSVITRTDDYPHTIETDYKIYQNYPNPFNPETIISYSLPKGDIVMLKVYDTLGREVAELVNGFKNAGTHNVIFNAAENNLSAGIYFYTLRTASYSQTCKMLLLK